MSLLHIQIQGFLFKKYIPIKQKYVQNGFKFQFEGTFVCFFVQFQCKLEWIIILNLTNTKLFENTKN